MKKYTLPLIALMLITSCYKSPSFEKRRYEPLFSEGDVVKLKGTDTTGVLTSGLGDDSFYLNYRDNFGEIRQIWVNSALLEKID